MRLTETNQSCYSVNSEEDILEMVVDQAEEEDTSPLTQPQAPQEREGASRVEEQTCTGSVLC